MIDKFVASKYFLAAFYNYSKTAERAKTRNAWIINPVSVVKGTTHSGADENIKIPIIKSWNSENIMSTYNTLHTLF